MGISERTARFMKLGQIIDLETQILEAKEKLPEKKVTSGSVTSIGGLTITERKI